LHAKTKNRGIVQVSVFFIIAQSRVVRIALSAPHRYEEIHSTKQLTRLCEPAPVEAAVTNPKGA
jgi:hypothetical protein